MGICKALSDYAPRHTLFLLAKLLQQCKKVASLHDMYAQPSYGKPSKAGFLRNAPAVRKSVTETPQKQAYYKCLGDFCCASTYDRMRWTSTRASQKGLALNRHTGDFSSTCKMFDIITSSITFASPKSIPGTFTPGNHCCNNFSHSC